MWQPGTVVAERYRITEELASGGMGAIYRATDTLLARDVALKVILERYAKDDLAIKRFEREARVAAAIDHPNVVRIFDIGRFDDAFFLVMELLEGHDLLEHIFSDAFHSLEQKLEVGVQLAEALAHAHGMRVVHRDIKPDNVVVTSVDPIQVKVVDFGLAVIVGDELGRGMVTTQKGVVGTPCYIAPERIGGGLEAGTAGDVYSLGCLLYELFTKRLPFEEPSLSKLLAMHLHRPVPDPNLLVPSLPRSLAELIMQMMAKKPSSRPHAAAVAARLRHLLGTDGRDEYYSARQTSSNGDGTAVDRPTTASEAGIAIWGELDDDCDLALRSYGVTPRTLRSVTEARGSDSAVIALEASLEDISLLAAGAAPVVADVQAGDIARIRALLRAGVADVVCRPVQAHEIVRKLDRVLRGTER